MDKGEEQRGVQLLKETSVRNLVVEAALSRRE